MSVRKSLGWMIWGADKEDLEYYIRELKALTKYAKKELKEKLKGSKLT